MIVKKAAKSVKSARAKRTPKTVKRVALRGPMAVILRNVPPGYHWGWYSREDQRMHLQVVDEKHKHFGYKVWLEANGRRTFEPVGAIPAKILKPLREQVAFTLPSIEAQWANFMIKWGWLRHVVRGPIITLIAYPDTPNRFERIIDLRDHLAPAYAQQVRPQDVTLNSEFAVVALWPENKESGHDWIEIPPILWGR